MKHSTFLLIVLCLFLAAVVVLIGCSSDTDEGQGGKADLIELTIGGLSIGLKAGVSGKNWNAEDFSIRSMARAEAKLPDSLMDKPEITVKLSNDATALFSRMTTESKPDAFAANREFTFDSADYLYIQVTNKEGNVKNYYRVMVFSTSGDARLTAMTISGASVVLANPGKTSANARDGRVTIKGMYQNDTVQNPVINLVKAPTAKAEYSVGETPGEFSGNRPALSNGISFWVRITAEDALTVLFYKIRVMVEYSSDSYGTPDPAWASNAYNANLRIFPGAPGAGILEYDYFGQNAPVAYWNGKGHNHKYPDLFHFANGNVVKNIADWENRRKEIANILQYYMHGRMPSIDPEVLTIEWSDSANTCTINLTHVSSGRTAQFAVSHTPPAGAVVGARDKIILFEVGFASGGRSSGWGTATFQTSWGGSESDRSGTCATLYGLSASAADTPSVNMEYAWAMSVILTVIEQGGLNGYYDPEKIGIYGFSRWGKAAMLIGAFAQSRAGNQTGFTFVGSAGSGGPAIDRWINQMGYKNHTEDPLPVSGGGVNSFDDLKGIEWYMKDNIPDDHNAASASQVVRGWTADTLGIPAPSHAYGESYDKIRNPGPPETWGRIQVLSQARSEVAGWFSARFAQLQALHTGAMLDINSGGVVCTMPFDAHYIAALIAPRIIYYEDGYNTMRNNPEGQWANWMICDELYQMYAEELGDPSIIWRNAIKMYDIEHGHFDYQNQDEADLVNALYTGVTPNAKFRTPPFPADDPRYRWDFDRMDFGRPGHPSIAERVKAMRESPVPVKAMDARGLLDTPEPLN